MAKDNTSEKEKKHASEAEKATGSTAHTDQASERMAGEEHDAAADELKENTDESGAGEETSIGSQDSNSSAEEVSAEAKEEQEKADEESDETSDDPVSREEELESKLVEMQDRYLRLTAEYDNYRKRTLKEKLDLQNTSREEVIIKLLSVVDDFDRAMDSIDTAKDLKAVKDGVKLIHGKFQGFLTQEGVKEIDAKNKAFDTDLHEAVTKIAVPEKKKKGKVVDVIEKGYTLKDRVIRFAKVVIGE